MAASTDQGKRCSKCRTIKPHDDFGLSTRITDGRQYYCKACARHYRRSRKGSGLAPGWLKCETCQHAKRESDFIRQRGTETGFMPDCRACVDAFLKARNRQQTLPSIGEKRLRPGEARDRAHYSRYLSATSGMIV